MKKNVTFATKYITSMQETICALSTPLAMGAIAVIRVSGEQALPIVQQLFCPAVPCRYEPRKAYFGEITDGNRVLDEVLCTYFKAPHSFTGEDMVEISCHGSLYVQKRMVELLIEHGCRHAMAGEFTQRAFLNGKMDLSQAEGVADVIASRSRSAHALAIKGLKGSLSAKIKELRRQLLHFAAMLELELDFSEEDVEFANRDMLCQLLQDIISQIDILLHSFSQGNAIKEGIPVVIAGKPNTGKSTLLNALLQEDRAIVSDIPGTTRDTVEELFNIGGFTFRFIDTAGIHHSNDRIENCGIERAKKSLQQADIVLLMSDGRQAKDAEQDYASLLASVAVDGKHVIRIVNKLDLLPADYEQHDGVLYISAKHGLHIDALQQQLLNIARSYEGEQEVLLSNVRHYEALYNAKQSLSQALASLQAQAFTDCVAIDIRQGLYHLGEVTGEISNNDILNEIFSRFCIGK